MRLKAQGSLLRPTKRKAEGESNEQQMSALRNGVRGRKE